MVVVFIDGKKLRRPSCRLKTKRITKPHIGVKSVNISEMASHDLMSVGAEGKDAMMMLQV